VRGSSAVAFWHGRVTFIDPDTGEYSHGAPFPSAIVAHNIDRSRVVDEFRDVAWVVS
jgi:hypothetical protein